jgi:hypothetical protein
MREDDELADPNHLVVNDSDEHLAATASRLFDRALVFVDRTLVFDIGRQGTALDNERRRGNVVLLNRANDDVHLARIDRGKYAEALLDRLGGGEAQVISKEIANDLHSRRRLTR